MKEKTQFFVFITHVASQTVYRFSECDALRCALKRQPNQKKKNNNTKKIPNVQENHLN